VARTVGWFTSVYPVAVDLTGIDVADAVAGGAPAGGAEKGAKGNQRPPAGMPRSRRGPGRGGAAPPGPSACAVPALLLFVTVVQYPV
ncbi:hypothetical protein, partial [Nocardia abscessus]|uniref:hypothetical protein n=1 Tax=Nocardia abscessus TaxID=120957 RepID=UPI0024551C39